METKVKKDTITAWLFRVLKGMLMGVGAILPGVSGGALSIVFGIYKPMMAFLAHPLKSFKKNFAFFLPIIIGVGLGFIMLSRLLAFIFERYEIEVLWLFVGLIIGTFPSLFREAGEEGHGKNAWISLAISFAVILVLLLLVNDKVQTSLEPNFFWYIVCGGLWGASMVVPGLSSSNFIMNLGLYESMSKGIGSLDMSVILPMVIGFVVIILLAAKGVNYLFKKHYAVAFHAILGTVIASTVMLIPWSSIVLSPSLLIYAACFVVGLAAALLMDNMSQKANAKQAALEQEEVTPSVE